MGIRLVKECLQTGEDWVIYEISVPYDGEWASVWEIEAEFIGNRINLKKPVMVSIH